MMRASSLSSACDAKNLLVTEEQRTQLTSDSTTSPGRLLALDLGAKRVGIAVCDELRLSVRPLPVIQRGSWKDLLNQIKEQVHAFEAQGLVIGLPLNLDGSEGEAAMQARQTAEKFRLSLDVPVYLEDERLTSEEAKSRLKNRNAAAIHSQIDSAAAAVILEDFLSRQKS
jgi:putative Holliday junction resolvase